MVERLLRRAVAGVKAKSRLRERARAPHNPAVDDLDSPAPRAPRFGEGFVTDAWYLVAMSDEVKPGRLVRRRLAGDPLVIGREATGAPFALLDVCPHRAAPLSAGRLIESGGEAQVECPYHGWRFGPDGRCRAIPSLTEGQAFDVSRVRVRRYRTAESQGMVFVWLPSDGRADVEPDSPPPTFPGVIGAPKLVLHNAFDAHVDHAAVGLMDPAHGPFVHQQWWWRGAGSKHAKSKRYEPSHFGFTMARHAPSSNSRAYALLGGAPTTEIVFRLPAYRWEHVRVGEKQLMTLTALTPESEARTAVTQILWSDHLAASLLKPVVKAGAKRFLAQDRAMVDLQKEGLARGATLLWIDDADRPAKWYQALKREWFLSRAEGRAFVNPVEPATLKWVS